VPNIVLSGGSAATSGFNMGTWNSGLIIAIVATVNPTSSATLVTYTSGSTVLRVSGTFTAFDANGDPTAGTVTGIEYTETLAGVSRTMTITGLSLSVPTLNGALFGAADLVTGSDFADGLFGYGGNDTLRGGLGIDNLYGGAGNDDADGQGGIDFIFGEDGADTLLGGDGDDRIDGGADADTLDGGADNDSLTGGLGADSLLGGAGNDTLIGGAGANTLLGGDGNDSITSTDAGDSIDGGAGTDLLTWDRSASSANFTLLIAGGNLASGGVTVATGIESFNARTGSGADTLTITGSSVGSFDAGTGIDRIIADFSADASSVTLSYFQPNQSGQFIFGGGFGTVFSFSGIESFVVAGGSAGDALQGGTGADDFTGNGGADSLNGNDGDDTLRGGDGDDFLFGGSGADSLLGGAGNDYLNTLGLNTGGVDLIDGGDGQDRIFLDFTQSSGVSISSAGFASSTGGALPNGTTVRNVESVQLAGGAGNDTLTLIGLTGPENNFTGGGGTDRLVVDLTGETQAAALSQSGFDLIVGNLPVFQAPRVTFSEVEEFWITGGSAGDTLYGRTANDRLAGGGGADTLIGGSGDDFLIGGGGLDVLDGGAGYDAASYAGGRSGFVVRASIAGGVTTLQVIDSVGGEGSDSLGSVELLQFSGQYFGIAGVQQNHLSVFDGSRFDDVLLRNTVTGQVIYADMNGTTTFAGYANILGALPSGWRATGSGDVTGDGRGEVFIQDTTTGSIYTYNAASATWGVVTTSLTGAYQLLGLGDFTQDGVVDILIRDSVSGAVFYGDVEAGGAFSSWTAAVNLGTGWRTSGVGDFDRDGYSDVLVQELSTGVTYYRDVRDGQWGFVSGALGTGWVAKEAADVNGDGYTDVIFQNTTSGDIWYVNMLGGTNAGWGVVASGLTGWDVRGTADVDNDGYLDVVVQNTATGVTYYADMNAGLFAGWGVVSSPLGADWIVA
jgi:Ca2+-binding RTX toxin-like protein